MNRGYYLAVLVVCVTTGCGGATSFVNPEADMAFYEVVAIAPFENLTNDQTASVAVQRVFRTELWAKGYWKIVSAGDWARAEAKVREELSIDKSQPLPQESVAMMGQELGAQGIFTGSVWNYTMQRVGQDEWPLVALTFEFVDAATGTVIWDISLSERGGPKFPFLGFGETHTLADLSQKLCSKALGGLSK